MAMFSGITVTVDHAVEARSGHSVGVKQATFTGNVSSRTAHFLSVLIVFFALRPISRRAEFKGVYFQTRFAKVVVPALVYRENLESLPARPG